MKKNRRNSEIDVIVVWAFYEGNPACGFEKNSFEYQKVKTNRPFCIINQSDSQTKE